MGMMTVSSYANLDDIRDAIQGRRIIEFVRFGTKHIAEPHVLAMAPRYGAFILGAWILGERERWEFIRYCEIRKLRFTPDVFEASRPEYNPSDRRIAVIDTCVRRPLRR